MRIFEHEPLTADEQPALEKIAKLPTDDSPVELLVGSDGKVIRLPEALASALKQIAYHMTINQAIFVEAAGPMLSIEETASILGFAISYIIKVLDEGKIPFTKVDGYRKIRVDDFLKFKKQLEKEQEEALSEIARISQELGLYD